MAVTRDPNIRERHEILRDARLVTTDLQHPFTLAETSAAESPRPQALSRRVANVLRRPIRAISGIAAKASSSRTIVLCYHSIGKSRCGVSPAMFGEQMAFLKMHAHVVSLDEVLRSGRSVSPLTCVLTFDDGYAGVYEEAFPILQKFDFPAVVYVTTRAIDEPDTWNPSEHVGLYANERMLSWSRLCEMASYGITTGSHLCHHKIMTSLSRREGLDELIHSKDIISQQLGVPCRHFAYPFGLYSTQSVEWVKRSGYDSAVTVQHRPFGARLDRFRLPRMCVAPIHLMDDFRQMLVGQMDYLFLAQRMRRALRLPYPS